MTTSRVNRVSDRRLLLVCIIFLGACVLPGDDSGKDLPPCECPSLIRVVESIEWVPGVEGRQRDAAALDDQSRRVVSYVFEVEDPTRDVDRLASALEDGGLVVSENEALRGFTVDGPGYNLTVNELQGELHVSVALIEPTTDEEAEKLLRPVIEAIGPTD